MNRLQNKPLTVNYNDSNNQKFVTIPSSSTSKDFSDIEPDQKIFPIAVDKRWNEDYYPAYLQIHELLERTQELLGLIENIATDYELEKSTGGEPAEELAWLSESVAELLPRFDKYRSKIEQQYNLNDHDIEAGEFTKGTIKKEHAPQMKEKYEELQEKQAKKIEKLLDEFDKVKDFSSHGHEVEIHFESREDVRVPLNPDLEGYDEVIYKFVKKLNEIFEEREQKFVQFAEELGYEHRLTESELGFHQFKYEGYVVEVPMTMPENQGIEVYEK